ncbi:MAG: hypothetical protein V3U90_06255, partial [Dehalococcoidia bacterium]
IVLSPGGKKLDNTAMLFLVGELTSTLRWKPWIESVSTRDSRANRATLNVRLSKAAPLLDVLQQLPFVKNVLPIEQNGSGQKGNKSGGFLDKLGLSKSRSSSQHSPRRKVILTVLT